MAEDVDDRTSRPVPPRFPPFRSPAGSFTSRHLRGFIDPNHLLIRIDERLDFAKLVEPLEEYYCPDFRRPAIHPEVMVRALPICSLYNIASFRRLCLSISANIACCPASTRNAGYVD